MDFGLLLGAPTNLSNIEKAITKKSNVELTETAGKENGQLYSKEKEFIIDFNGKKYAFIIEPDNYILDGDKDKPMPDASLMDFKVQRIEEYVKLRYRYEGVGEIQRLPIGSKYFPIFSPQTNTIKIKILDPKLSNYPFYADEYGISEELPTGVYKEIKSFGPEERKNYRAMQQFFDRMARKYGNKRFIPKEDHSKFRHYGWRLQYRMKESK